MKNILRNTITVLALGLAATLTAASAPAQQSASTGGRDAALESLRAGAVNDSAVVLVATERESLASAAASATMLEALRADDLDLSHHELEIILITAAVVLILVVIL